MIESLMAYIFYFAIAVIVVAGAWEIWQRGGVGWLK